MELTLGNCCAPALGRPQQFVKMLTAKDRLGHTILQAAVTSHSEETCNAVFNVAQEYLNQEQVRHVSGSIPWNEYLLGDRLVVCTLGGSS